MNKILKLILFLLISKVCVAQPNQVIGKKIDKLVITDFISNTPTDINFDKKYKVLEFWATWCAPCIAAVPHLNQLHSQLKNETRLVFISMTDESPLATKNIMKKVKFSTIVVSDQSRYNHKALGVEQDGTISIPQTFLIDDNNIVRWTGHPTQLNLELIGKFIKNQPLDVPITINNIKNEYKTEDNLIKIAEDNNVINFFALSNISNVSNSKMSIFSLPTGKYLDINTDLVSIISKLILTQKYKILIPDSLINKHYNLLYKNSNLNQSNFNEDVFISELSKIKQMLLNSLQLKEYRTTKSFEVNSLRIKDEGKLVVSNLNDKIVHSGNSDTHLIISNINLTEFSKLLSDRYNIIIEFDEVNNKKYDFYLKITNDKKELQIELANYGLHFEKVMKEVVCYDYK